MRYDFNHVPDRRPSDSVKWNQYDADVLPLWVADMDFPVAEPIQRALRERIEHGIYGYPDVLTNCARSRRAAAGAGRADG